MNCRDAERQILSERDSALSSDRGAALAEHLAGCASCRRQREALETAFSTLRSNTRNAAVPDAELEWQQLRREIRGGATATGRPPARGVNRVFWYALPFAAAAAVAVALYVRPGIEASPRAAGPAEKSIARVTARTIGADSSSTVVFVDEKSGWTFVVAPGDAHQG